MKIRLILLPAFIGALAAQAQSTINFSAFPGDPDVWYNGSAPVPDGNRVSIGFFSSGFDVQANGGNSTALRSAWNELGGTSIQPIFEEPGRFAGTLYNTDPLFDNQKIWMWIFKTYENSAPSGQYENVASYGLYSSTENSWLFPAHNAPPGLNTTIISSYDINLAAFGTYDSTHLFLTPVPEPRSWLLGSVGMGILLLLGLRGRRTKAEG